MFRCFAFAFLLFIWGPDCSHAAGVTCEFDLTSAIATEVRQIAEEAHQETAVLLSQLTVPPWPLFSDRGVRWGIHQVPAIVRFKPYRLNALPVAFANENGFFDRRGYITLIQHELGHVVFAANMASLDPAWSIFFEGALNPDPQALLVYPDTFLISLPYQELFADLLAVTAADDPQAMVRCLLRVFENPEITTRHFAHAPATGTYNAADVHNTLSPMRVYLWQNHFKSLRSSEEKARELARVFQILAAEVFERARDPNLLELTPVELNQRLLDRFSGR